MKDKGKENLDAALSDESGLIREHKDSRLPPLSQAHNLHLQILTHSPLKHQTRLDHCSAGPAVKIQLRSANINDYQTCFTAES